MMRLEMILMEKKLEDKNSLKDLKKMGKIKTKKLSYFIMIYLQKELMFQGLLELCH
jgi:hypothetical protein